MMQLDLASHKQGLYCIAIINIPIFDCVFAMQGDRSSYQLSSRRFLHLEIC